MRSYTMKIRNNIWALLFSVVLSTPALAIDKAAIIENIKESYSFPPGLDISLSEPKPSEIPGFDVLDLKIAHGNAQQMEKLYLSKDGHYYVLGGFKDVRVSPDKERMKKIDLSNAPVRGDKKAPVTVVEYTDFQCPYCEIGYQVMRRRIMREYGSQVRWVYKSLPLKSIHPWAEPAAIGAECAYRQGKDKFWAVHDDIFEHQKEISLRNIDDKLADFSKTAGLDVKKFQECYKGRETVGDVNKDVAEAESLNIPGTPAFVIDGRLIPSADYDSLKQTIDSHLKKKA